MTNADIFCRILAEVMGRPVAEVRALLDDALAKLPTGATKFDQELPPAEAEALLHKLRGKKPAIQAWLVAGALESFLTDGPPIKR